MCIHLFPPWHQYTEDVWCKSRVDEPGTRINSTAFSFNSDFPCPVKVTTSATMTPSVKEKIKKSLWAFRSSLYALWHLLDIPPLLWIWLRAEAGNNWNTNLCAVISSEKIKEQLVFTSGFSKYHEFDRWTCLSVMSNLDSWIRHSDFGRCLLQDCNHHSLSYAMSEEPDSRIKIAWDWRVPTEFKVQLHSKLESGMSLSLALELMWIGGSFDVKVGSCLYHISVHGEL